jgi:L-aspartate oxidase
VREFDILVIGSGVAGMSAAIEAAEQGASVALAWAGPGSSERAQGGLAAAVGPGDDARQHRIDTLAAGDELCLSQTVEILTEQARSAVEWLEAHGVVFDRDPQGGPALALEAAHSQARVLHLNGDRSGAAMVAALRAKLERVVCFEESALDGLLVGEGGARGAAFAGPAGRVDVAAGATILATGGYAGLYARTTTSRRCDGFGLISALLAGAELTDLEMVQFHPTVYAGPGRPFLVSEAVRGAGAQVRDVRGRSFLSDVDPRGELAPRSVVARAISEHLRQSGDSNVLLDARHLGPEVLAEHFAGFRANCRGVGLDPLRDMVPIAPAAHYSMGGIVTDERGQTRVPGLFAAGECAWTGVHGANRLASNSLLEAVVFGRRAAQSALAEATSWSRDQAVSKRILGGGELERSRIGVVLDQVGGPLRDASGLKAGLRLLAIPGAAVEDEAARRLACLILESALLREESRGAHVRIDHPGRSPEWAQLRIVASSGNDGKATLNLRVREKAVLLVNHLESF